MTSFAKSMSRALKKYIPDGAKEEGVCFSCNSAGLVRQEGCVTCTQCGWSKMRLINKINKPTHAAQLLLQLRQLILTG